MNSANPVHSLKSLTIFGMVLLLLTGAIDPAFAQQATKKSAAVSTEPDTYKAFTILGPGDKIKISYLDIGQQGTPVEKSNIVSINQDGTIFHELLGKVSLEKLSVSEAEELLTIKFSQYFTSPTVNITVLEKRMEDVLLYGEVPRIGIYPIQPNTTTVAEFIIMNGGTTVDADISRISVNRIDGTTIIFDMERYLYTNQPVNNIVLKDKDKVIVPRAAMEDKYSLLSKNYILQYGNIVEISINEASLTESKPADTESYIIDTDGNIYHKLFGAVRLGGMTIDKAQTVLAGVAKQYYREPVVRISVVELSARNIFVFGQVNRPGIYPISGNVRLAEFLATIGGLTAAADLKSITVTRKDGNTVVFNMDRFLYHRADKKNIFLEDGDRIIVPNRQRGIFVNIAEKVQPIATVLTLVSTIFTIYIVLNNIK